MKKQIKLKQTKRLKQTAELLNFMQREMVKINVCPSKEPNVWWWDNTCKLIVLPLNQQEEPPQGEVSQVSDSSVT